MCRDEILFFQIFSDIVVKIGDQKLHAHKFILGARSDFWSNRDLNELSELELVGMSTLNISITCMVE